MSDLIESLNNKKLTIKEQINAIFENNKVNDLKSFLYKRHFLNNCNISLIYLFHITQSAGILTTAIATSYNNTQLIWIGIGINCLATLINVFEKTNINISKKYMKDIQDIKDDIYIDESDLDFETNIKKINNKFINK